ncbi:MAG: glycosyl transferase [Zunongwangia sp.]|mgnify:CR=1 FL=1|jgi:glycosyltransferase involved in cell wall biosynthesis|nr:glycosyltransferase [Zunongwangia profunda]MAG89035.1 glycosyl transferase [Flavobacteriaceae bacterium]MAO35674.1 glycosyl transferase [Zunongwangia sp.]MCC4230171.1 glycosyltransferase [Zunongwangia profunda]|tara:strand:+ start:15345 stop:16433 length:1089 start_codon:yes stop_codon:yes gene_type:complete
MISIIYPYRNRDLKRVERSFESLKNQSVQNFQIYFVDYGSEPEIKECVRELCGAYSKIKYIHHATRFQPWNKAKALNSVVKKLETEICFVADIDMIFHPEFLKTAISLQEPEKSVYFKVSFSESDDRLDGINPEDFDQFRHSDHHATGLTMFSVKALKSINGFDEFYHLWGAEDTDVHVRLRNAGFKVEFYEKEILMLHQWHESYRISEKIGLTAEFQIKKIVQLNHQHLKYAEEYGITRVNSDGWGKVMTAKQESELLNCSIKMNLNDEKRTIENLIYGVLSSQSDGIFKVKISESENKEEFKNRLKKLAGKKIPEFYTMKEINDLLLMHIISFYRDRPYIFQISEDIKSITIAINFRSRV